MIVKQVLLAGQTIMHGMTQFVSQRRDIAQIAGEVEHDERLPFRQDAHAEGSAAFAGSRINICMALLENFARRVGQF